MCGYEIYAGLRGFEKYYSCKNECCENGYECCLRCFYSIQRDGRELCPECSEPLELIDIESEIKDVRPPPSFIATDDEVEVKEMKSFDEVEVKSFDEVKEMKSFDEVKSFDAGDKVFTADGDVFTADGDDVRIGSAAA